VRNVVKKLDKHDGPNPQHDALKVAIMTSPKVMNKETMRALAPLIRKYVLALRDVLAPGGVVQRRVTASQQSPFL
jgi:hypothetical protein